MQSDLHQLKNLGNTSIHWLRTIGVHSVDDLKRKGVVAAYNEIKQRGIRVSRVLLYALYGAIHDIHWNDLDASIKAELVEQADSQVDRSNA